MDSALLRKVQLTQLEIAKEIRRVCEENNIRYFLCCGTFLGAIRHQGFIPWDDDMDVGMLREDYEKFCRIAPEKLSDKYCLQSWYTEPNYALPFAKVRMKNTRYIEAKSADLQEKGFYVDVFPFDYAPENEREQKKLAKKLAALYRIKLMQSGSKPWMDNDRINWKKRIGYLYYQLRGMCINSADVVNCYEELAKKQKISTLLYRQRGYFHLECYDAALYQEFGDYSFEGEQFSGPKEFDLVLRTQFGDYLQLPPEEERENRHQIIEVDFGC